MTYLHRPGLTVKAEFSPEDIPIFRYYLEITRNGDRSCSKTVCAIMQNPSYANVEIADKSVQVLEKVVFEKDYEELKGVQRLIIVNQFGYIQTKNFIGNEEQIGKRNEKAIIDAIDKADIVLIAWGKANKYIERKKNILKVIQAKKEIVVLQTSRHPSRVIYDGFIQQFSFEL
jgi:hypothetical protein